MHAVVQSVHVIMFNTRYIKILLFSIGVTMCCVELSV